MASSIIQVKRTAVSGRTPNTTNSSNTQYIAAGELALNMTDGVLYTSDGSNKITVGSNLSSLTVRSIIANNTPGSAGQVLSSNGSGVYWTSVTSVGATPTFKTIQVPGESSIIAEGDDTLTFANGAGIVLTTSAVSPKTITISSVTGGAAGYFDGGNPFSAYTGGPVFDAGGVI
jgi:hypothetical protein